MLEFIHKTKNIITIFSIAFIVLSPINIYAQACMGYTVEGVQVTEDSHGDIQVNFNIHTDEADQQLFVNVELAPSTNIVITSQFALVNTIEDDGSFQFTAEGDYIDAIIGLPDDLELSGIIYIGTIGEDMVCELPFEGIIVDELIFIDYSDDDVFTSYDVCGQLVGNGWIDLNGEYPLLNVDIYSADGVTPLNGSNYSFNIPDYDQYIIDFILNVNQSSPESLNMQIASLDMEAIQQASELNFTVLVNVNDEVFCEVPVTVDLASAVISGTIINTDDVFGQTRVYPNPADAKTTIDLSDNFISTTNNEVTIIDIIGQTIIELETIEEVTTIDVSTLAPGMYILKISDGINNKTTKLMIE